MAGSWESLEQSLSAATGEAFHVERSRPVGGGCINEAVVLEGCARRYFVKLNSAGRLPMFEAEADGLEAILASGALRAPRPVATGTQAGRAWLALEYLPLGRADQSCHRALGEHLAALHNQPREYFGWHRDNTIGATPQPNTPTQDWVSFLRERRLGFQLELARANGAGARLLDPGLRLLELLPAFFTDYRPQPSLLHGDLWGGNWGADETGAPVVFDPAVYCGDGEADLAMTELFGGFGPGFYDAYRQCREVDPGYRTRRELYNLYHVLNHFNLFGGGYTSQAETMIRRLVAAAG